MKSIIVFFKGKDRTMTLAVVSTIIVATTIGYLIGSGYTGAKDVVDYFLVFGTTYVGGFTTSKLIRKKQ